MGQDDAFFAELLATFTIEAQEHVDAMSTGLLLLERTPAGEQRQSLIETVFRAAHSLKGAARAVSLTDVERLCQSLESVLSAVKREEIALTARAFETLYRSVDAVSMLLAPPAAGDEDEGPRLAPEFLSELDALAAGGIGEGASPGPRSRRRPPSPPAPNPSSTPSAPPSQDEETQTGPEAGPVPRAGKAAARPRRSAAGAVDFGSTVRIAGERLDTVLLQAEEMLAAKLAAMQLAADLDEAVGRLRHLEHTENLESVVAELDGIARSAQSGGRLLGVMVDNLLQDTKKLLMLPCSSLLQAFPKMVRDISLDMDKDVDLQVEGAQVELDKRILEKLKDPLVHLVRNCIDHGIETPEERLRRDKAPRATVRIAVSQVDSNRVEVIVADDGAGIDLDGVKKAAVMSGLLQEDGVGDSQSQDATALIFLSGVSTSPIITNMSGRGLGLAIVRENIEELGGQVSVETQVGAGTTFRLVLPVTHTTFRGVIVRAGKQMFVVPTVSVERVCQVDRADVVSVENRETLSLNGDVISLIRLEDVLEQPRSNGGTTSKSILAIVLRSGETRAAFYVDEVLQEQEVLVKRLGKLLSRVRNVAGACILGSGDVVPVLNTRDLMSSAERVSGTFAQASQPAGKTREQRQQSILLVEDSVTSRMLLKNIIEAAGYRVTTAVDGLDGLTALRSGNYDLVVSDIVMPRMNGLELTEQIRADDVLQRLPVVLVTSLESREDREHGISAGASAYIVKSSFDNADLLETVRRLTRG